MRYIIQRELAENLGLDVRSIRRLEEAGLPLRSRAGRKSYPWPEALRWYVGWKVESEVGRRRPSDNAELERRELEAKVRLAEIKVAEAEGKVLPDDVVRRQMSEIHQATAGAIRSLPQYAGEMVELSTLAEARVRLEKIADELLARARGDYDDEDDGESSDVGDSE